MKLIHVTYRKAGTSLCTSFRGRRRIEFGKPKTVQNSARFRRTTDCDREYFRYGWRCRQAENGVINYDFAGSTKNGEIWSTNKNVYAAVYALKMNTARAV